MKLFISWSGDRTKHIALAFREWLPTVIPELKPWMSEVDLPKGSEWNQKLTEELEGTSLGLFCLTPESLPSPWLLFEAGAIAKRPGTKRVYTYLFDLADNDVPWPLANFQSTKVTKEDTLKMLSEMNTHLKEPLQLSILQIMFNRGWSDLESALKKVSKVAKTEPKTKTKTEMMLEEILAYVRQQNRQNVPVNPQFSVWTVPASSMKNPESLVLFRSDEDISKLYDSLTRLREQKSRDEPPMPRLKTPPKREDST